jgi:hypothetical protein
MLLTTFENQFAAVWEGIVAAVVVLLSIIAIIRYVKKRSGVAFTLAIALTFFAIAMIFQVIGQVLTNDNFPVYGSLWSSGNPLWGAGWMLQLVEQFQFAYFFLILGLLMLFRFALLLNPDNKKSTLLSAIALALAIAIIAFGVIRAQFPIANLGDVQAILYEMDPWVIVFGLLMVIPMISVAWRMYVRIQAGTVEQRRLRFMVLMGWILLAMLAMFVLQAVFGALSLPDAGYWVNMVGFGAAMVASICAYLSFYAR